MCTYVHVYMYMHVHRYQYSNIAICNIIN
jgi:hypothetical protein